MHHASPLSTGSRSITDRQAIVLALSAFIVTHFLFFIDEGYYNFHWMTAPGNWLVFIIYTICIFSSQVMLAVALRVVYQHLNQPILGFIILGRATLGILFLVTDVF